MMTPLPPGVDELLPAWLARQRWYAGKGRTPLLRPLDIDGPQPGWLDPAGPVSVGTHLLLETSGPAPVLYQVPLTTRDAPVESMHQALVGTMQHGHGDPRQWIYDGCHDPVYVQALLHQVLGEQAPRIARSAVLTGEQSNTSIIIETTDGEQLIVKVFRVLHPGDNPDVEVQTAVAAVGSGLVPRPVGSLRLSWTDTEPRTGHAAFAQEFLPGVQDAWRTALLAARQEAHFAPRARALGAATADVHASLREAFGTTTPDVGVRTDLLRRLRERAQAAVTAVPDLAEHTEAIERVYAALETADWPVLQRVHGDYHLGQVLDVPDRGWVLVDFEGEPLRSLDERSAPDLALRDVAGMLRSFDYVAGSLEQEAGLDRRVWTTSARTAFLQGYREQDGPDLLAGQALLQALELDKALYEVVYEASNRPGWLPIPVAAVTRLLTETPDHPPSTAPDAEEAPVTTPQTPSQRPLDARDAERVVRGQHNAPHAVLGAHPHDGGVTVRVLRPMAGTVTLVLPGGETVPMEHETHGIWRAVLARTDIPDYRVDVEWGDGITHRQDDPYRFLPTIGELDQHLISEGRHEQLWTVLGAHVRRYDGPLGAVVGTSFAVWAPNARGVHVIGDFNQWDSSAHPMRVLGSGGVWELFVPDAGPGTRYKFDITGPDGRRTTRADPMAQAAEVPPLTASVVTEARHEWSEGDAAWLRERADRDPSSGPMSVYEVHLGSWRQGLSYRDLADQLVGYVRELGFTHVELMPVMQHPYAPSWGYHVTGYYAADSRFGSPDDLRALIDALHAAGIGVILDWVPGHFATDPWALAQFDGTPLYEHPDPRKGWHSEWGSYVFDYGRKEVRNFLVANALFWLEEFHADGLRVDGVASMLYLDYGRNEGEWVPNRHGGRENLEAVALLQEINATAYKRTPGIVTIAEESTSWPGVTSPTDQGGLGFGLKWNMGWMHDSLDYVARQPVHRQYHHHQLTFSLMYAFTERFMLPISHDEVVHGKGSLLRKMSGDRWQQLANLRAYLAFMWAHPGKQLLFMGCELAQESEWADGRSLDWWLEQQPAHHGVQQLMRDLNRVYRDTPALWEVDDAASGFQWLDADDAQNNTYSFLRHGRAADAGDGPASSLAVVANFAGHPRPARVGLPRGGTWREVLNTDADGYGGSGVGNMGRVVATDEPHHGQPHSIELMLPPLGVLWLVPEDPDLTETSGQQQKEQR